MPNSKPIHPAQKFAEDVNNGVIQTDHDLTVLCCAHNEELRLQKESYFPFQFDEPTATAYTNHLIKPLLHPATPAQQFFIWRAFGWIKKSDGSQRYGNKAF